MFHSVEPEDLFSADAVHRSSRRHTQQRAQAAAESQGQGANVGRTALRPETGAMSRWPGVEYPKMQSFSEQVLDVKQGQQWDYINYAVERDHRKSNSSSSSKLRGLSQNLKV